MSDSATRPTGDEEWENLLRQWRTQQHNQPRPFFYSRVRARLVGQAAAERQLPHAWLRWPSYALLLGVILLLSGDSAALRSTELTHSYELHSQSQQGPDLPAD